MPLTELSGMVNVPCTGEFKVTVYKGDEWNIILEHKNGVQYLRYSGSVHKNGTFFDSLDVFNELVIPDWMFQCLKDKVSELQISLERDSIYPTNTVGTIQ